jgi:hypothetical protein
MLIKEERNEDELDKNHNVVNENSNSSSLCGDDDLDLNTSEDGERIMIGVGTLKWTIVI